MPPADIRIVPSGAPTGPPPATAPSPAPPSTPSVPSPSPTPSTPSVPQPPATVSAAPTVGAAQWIKSVPPCALPLQPAFKGNMSDRANLMGPRCMAIHIGCSLLLSYSAALHSPHQAALAAAQCHAVGHDGTLEAWVTGLGSLLLSDGGSGVRSRQLVIGFLIPHHIAAGAPARFSA